MRRDDPPTKEAGPGPSVLGGAVPMRSRRSLLLAVLAVTLVLAALGGPGVGISAAATDHEPVQTDALSSDCLDITTSDLDAYLAEERASDEDDSEDDLSWFCIVYVNNGDSTTESDSDAESDGSADTGEDVADEIDATPVGIVLVDDIPTEDDLNDAAAAEELAVAGVAGDSHEDASSQAVTPVGNVWVTQPDGDGGDGPAAGDVFDSVIGGSDDDPQTGPEIVDAGTGDVDGDGQITGSDLVSRVNGDGIVTGSDLIENAKSGLGGDGPTTGEDLVEGSGAGTGDDGLMSEPEIDVGPGSESESNFDPFGEEEGSSDSDEESALGSLIASQSKYMVGLSGPKGGADGGGMWGSDKEEFGDEGFDDNDSPSTDAAEAGVCSAMCSLVPTDTAEDACSAYCESKMDGGADETEDTSEDDDEGNLVAKDVDEDDEDEIVNDDTGEVVMDPNEDESSSNTENSQTDQSEAESTNDQSSEDQSETDSNENEQDQGTDSGEDESHSGGSSWGSGEDEDDSDSDSDSNQDAGEETDEESGQRFCDMQGGCLSYEDYEDIKGGSTGPGSTSGNSNGDGTTDCMHDEVSPCGQSESDVDVDADPIQDGTVDCMSEVAPCSGNQNGVQIEDPKLNNDPTDDPEVDCMHETSNCGGEAPEDPDTGTDPSDAMDGSGSTVAGSSTIGVSGGQEATLGEFGDGSLLNDAAIELLTLGDESGDDTSSGESSIDDSSSDGEDGVGELWG